MSTAATVGV